MAGFDERDLYARHLQVTSHFPTALGVDDWISRVETVLATYGFTGDNTIAMTNLCRDEVTSILKEKIEAVFGSSFNTNGLGGVLTCGVTGMKAGLSHSPVCANGRERYVFFSFPHIAIDSQGTVGSISRPGRETHSCACGALAKCLNEFKAQGYANLCQQPGDHDPLDPEFSILRQRLARRLRYEKTDLGSLTLDRMTAVAERTITNDLEYLIERTVDHDKADYAVVTGIQIHNWSTKLMPGGPPSLEFVAPTKFIIVVNGKKAHLDLRKVPSLSPRQLMLLSSASHGNSSGPEERGMLSRGTGTTLQEVPYDYLTRRLGGAAVNLRASSMNGSDRASAVAKSPPRSPITSYTVTTTPHAVHPIEQQHIAEMQALWEANANNMYANDRDKAAPTMDGAAAPLLSRQSMVRASPVNLNGLAPGPLAPLLAAVSVPVAGVAAAAGNGRLARAASGLQSGGSGPGSMYFEDDDYNTSFLSRVSERFSKLYDRVSRTSANGPSPTPTPPLSTTSFPVTQSPPSPNGLGN